MSFCQRRSSDSSCADELAQTSARCDADAPFLVADLFPGLDDHIRPIRTGDRFYVNIYGDGVFGGQTWVTGLCGEDPVLVGRGEEFGAMRPAFLGPAQADLDPSLACTRFDGHDRLYRVDLTGERPPELLLESWPCHFSPARPVVTHDDGVVHELWRAPDYPDLTDSVRLATDIATEVGQDLTHNYYIGEDRALHAVDVRTGDDEILADDVLRATGGATGPQQDGPTRLLWLSGAEGEPQRVSLYRGETGELVELAAAEPADHPEKGDGWAWGFDFTRSNIYHQPYDGPQAVRAFDLDGAEVPFPAGVHSRSRSLTDGVIGIIDGPGGPRWVLARPGETEATSLDIPPDPDVQIFAIGAREIHYSLADRSYRVPLDGGPAIDTPYGYRYNEDEQLAVVDGDLLRVDWHTGATSVLRPEVGALAPAVTGLDPQEQSFELSGVFFTDTSSGRSRLWFMPASLLP